MRQSICNQDTHASASTRATIGDRDLVRRFKSCAGVCDGEMSGEREKQMYEREAGKGKERGEWRLHAQLQLQLQLSRSGKG